MLVRLWSAQSVRFQASIAEGGSTGRRLLVGLFDSLDADHCAPAGYVRIRLTSGNVATKITVIRIAEATQYRHQAWMTIASR